MELKSKLLDTHRGLYLYGTTPPRRGSSPEKLHSIAKKLTARLSNLNLDAINVYDIQDEEGRTQIARPFPFLPVVDSREYAQILNNLTGTDIINYKCVVHHPREDFSAWLDQSWQQFGLRYLTLVGGSTSQMAYPGPTLSQASEAIADHKYDFVFGGVTIAERHLSKGNEHLKLIEKSRRGMKFFTSQVVYQPEATIQLLQDYARQCQELNLSPVRIILTFAPCGHRKTLHFLKWLGVNFPLEAEQEIFSAQSPLQKSLEVCCSTLRRILESIEPPKIPLGINVESVSIKKDEIDASIELFQELKGILSSWVELNIK
ncbi:MAG: hypothetical protein QNJ41_17785 [Xenococcaceae cyanobacterium MO_188.B32]|nr:hypothetical protein [Xenococcaceae cyanobacterium MO_188.B32]